MTCSGRYTFPRFRPPRVPGDIRDATLPVSGLRPLGGHDGFDDPEGREPSEWNVGNATTEAGVWPAMIAVSHPSGRTGDAVHSAESANSNTRDGWCRSGARRMRSPVGSAQAFSA